MVTAIRSHIFRIGLAPSLPGIRALQQKEEDSVLTQRGAYTAGCSARSDSS